MQKFFLVIDNTETEIQQPEGWGDMQRSLSRQMDTFGFMEEFSKSDLTFYCDGSDLPGGLDLIQAAYNSKGPDADVYFKVTEDCNGNNIFETINYSLLDLYEAPNNADWYKAPIEPQSFQTLLSKRYKTQSNLLADKSIDNEIINVPELKSVYLPGKAIIRQYEAYPLIDTLSFLPSGDPDTAENQRSPTLYFGFDDVKRNEFDLDDPATGKKSGIYTLGTGFSFGDTLISTYDTPFRSSVRITVKLDTHIVIERNKGDFETVNINYWLKIRRDGVDTNILLEHNTKTNINGAYEWILTGSEHVTDWIELDAGDQVFLYGDVDVSDVAGPYRMTYRVNFKKTSYLKFEGYTVSTGSDGYGLLVHETFSKAIANLTGKDNIFISNYFGRTDSWPRGYDNTGCGGEFLFTIGKLLKGRFNPKDRSQIPLTTALNTLIEGLQAIFCIGYSYEYEGIEERVVVEPMEYFFQDYEILALDNISEFELAPAQDLIYNKIDVGYEKYETEEVNGADEFNSKRQYSTPIKKHENTLNLLSKLVTGGYPIEFTRQSRLKSNDYKYDNNNFLISVKTETTLGVGDVTYQIESINSTAGQTLFPGSLVIAIDKSANAELITNYAKFTILDNAELNGDYTILDYAGDDEDLYVYLSLSPAVSTSPTVTQGGLAKFDFNNAVINRLVAKLNDSFSTLNNVLDPSTIYNAELSPVRNLLRWAKYINGGLTYKGSNEVIKFTYGEANYLLESQLKQTETCLGGDVNKVLLKENQDFTLATFNRFTKLWVAEYITFKSELSYDDFLTIRENLLPSIDKAQKNGYISVDYLGDIYQGYPVEVNYEPNKHMCTFKLLKKYVKPTGLGIFDNTFSIDFE